MIDSMLKIDAVEKIKMPRGTKITTLFERKKINKEMKNKYDKEFKETLLIDAVLEVEDNE